MRFKIRQTILENNPAIFSVLFFLLICIITALYFHERFNFKEAGLFTFLWTFPVLVFVFTAVNFKRFRLLLRSGKVTGRISIAAIYLRSMIEFLPYLLIALLYENLILYSRAFKDYFNNVDLSLMRADVLLFGVNPAIWIEQFLHPIAADYFAFAYSLYVVYPYFYLLYIYQKKMLTVFHRTLLAQLLALFVSLTCYIVFPAVGPRYAANPEHHLRQPGMPLYSQQVRGVEFDLMEEFTGSPSIYQVIFDFWNELERIKTDCMPSMHVCLCLIALFYAMRYRAVFKWKKTAISFWIIGVTSLIISTVYLRYHWIVDVLAGAVLAIGACFLSEWIYSAWLRFREKNGIGPPSVKWLEEADALLEADALHQAHDLKEKSL